MPRHYEDFTGKEINGVIIKGLIEDSGGAGNHKKWLCECSLCHKEFVGQSNHIKTRKFAGCDECKRRSREDLTGQKFGRLTVDFMVGTNLHERSLCSCTCDCGASGIVCQANHLKSGETRSCGCVLSFSEEYISSLLSENNICYERQKTFPDQNIRIF